MKRSTFLRVMLGGVGAMGAASTDVRAQMPKLGKPVNTPPPAKDRSLQLEIEHAVRRLLRVFVFRKIL